MSYYDIDQTFLVIVTVFLRFKFSFICVNLKGLGSGKIGAIKGLAKSGIEIVSIVESTTISFGGTRPKKIRRV